ncbi:MAG: hypothetical protein CMI29_05640 [Opitutae bacterium]|nr:hypothetical protein [Opitutae bacterium]|tara:strand:- start:111 stop:644 length:534 start_codon:yes stop_codon:yes gene_type:complete
MKSIFLFPIALATSLHAEDSVSNADLSRKLDLILGKVSGLETRVAELEKANSEVKKEMQVVQKTAEEAKTASQTIALPEDEDAKKSFMSKLRLQLKSEEAKAAGAWTKEETWIGMRRNLTGFKVRKLLGNPNQIKKSLNPRIDQIYHYEGDLNADGTNEVGEVSLFRDRVVSFSSPF